MSEVRLLVDHIKFEYNGVFDIDSLFKHIQAWLLERGYEKKVDKNYQFDGETGKFIEWQISPWKKISDYNRNIMKLRMLIYDLNEIEVEKDNKKQKMGQAKIICYLDAFLEHDYEHRWDGHPMLLLFRTMYDRFIYKIYTERFEEQITYDAHHFFDVIQSFFNVYKHYKPIGKVPHFAH
ncbi:hypothetical protein ACFLZX_01425 [Nanoarchaeota archaeon]